MTKVILIDSFVSPPCILTDTLVRQNSELQSAVSKGGSDAQVNAVTARHLEASELASAEWDSAISGLKEQQLRNFRAMLRDGQVAGHAQ